MRSASPTSSAVASARHEPVWQSRAMELVMEQVRRVSAAPRITVLIDGESGVGKELVARAIHERSAPDAPFVALNCAALPEGLLEAELFGHEPGAFTGASPRGRAGLLEMAGNGTLLLDEIGELPLLLQARLLRVLQERNFRRVGGRVDLPLSARIVACTNRDLEAEVARGTFREDLFYRLNVLRLRVPALRERRDDIEPLIEHFCVRMCAETGLPAPVLSRADIERMRNSPWRGNVRELRNAVERAILLGPERALETVPPLASASTQPDAGADPRASASGAPSAQAASAAPLPGWDPADLSIEAMERALIRHVLGCTSGNRTQAARLLGVDRTTLYSKLRRYAIA